MKYVSSILMAVLFASSFGIAQDPTDKRIHIKTFVAPSYPAKARKSRIQGSTITEIKIGADGAVDSVGVVSAHPIFVDAVETALKRWVFDPIPQATTIKINVRFWLDGCDEQNGPYFGETLVIANVPDNVDVRTCIEPVVVTNDK